MAAALQCEICGGKLVGKPGGVFECDSCGMEYSTEWAKQKIQEIRGTVKVEGTVEVTGKVQVEGGSVAVEGAATKESLLKRAKMCIEDAREKTQQGLRGSANELWKQAQELLEQVLNADPECGEAYMYRYMAKHKLWEETFAAAYLDIDNREIADDPDVQKALRYCRGELAERLAKYKEERERAIQADLKPREELRPILAQKRKLAKLAASRISPKGHYGLRTDGTVVGGNDEISAWRNIIAIDDTYYNCTIGLRADGTVVVAGDASREYIVRDWRNITAIAYTSSHTVGLRADDTVVAEYGGSSNYYKGQCDVSGWTNIVSIACGDSCTVGLRADGTVVAAGAVNKASINSWKDITAIACSSDGNIVGLHADGTTTMEYGIFIKEADWRDIVELQCGPYNNFVGLRADGTVITTSHEKEIVKHWRDIIAIDTVRDHLVGLRADGTVVTTDADDANHNNMSEWKDVIAISGGCGLRADGTVVGRSRSGWKLFNSIDTLEDELRQSAKKWEEQKRLAAQRHAERERLERTKRRDALDAEAAALQTELSNLKGFFSGKRRREIETRLAAIKTEQKGL